MKLVAFMTRLSNYVIADDTAFPYDTAVYINNAYMTWAGSGNPLVCARAGRYAGTLVSTTLGTNYGGASNSDWIHAIGRNGVTLADTILSERHAHSSGATADLMTTGLQVFKDLFSVGDTIEVYYQNINGSTILVESNPTDGPDYTTDVGPGTLSPHLQIFWIGDT